MARGKKELSIDEKIDIFSRFLKKENVIVGKTVFEGHPIGRWGIQIRNRLQRNTLHLTDEQSEKLEELGILERQIDAKIDEKIQQLVAWNMKYPKAQMFGHKKNIMDIIRSYSNSEEEFKMLVEEYRTLCKYYVYIKSRKYAGKLTPEQEETCREGNVRGPFGYPTKTLDTIQKLVEKYRINEKKVIYILDKYSSMEEFIKAYREGNLDDQDKEIFKYNLNNMCFDISGANNHGYEKLLRKMKCLDENKLVIYDSEKIKTFLEKLSPNRATAIKMKFGINEYEKDGEKSVAEIAKHMKKSSSCIREFLNCGIKDLHRCSKAMIGYSEIPVISDDNQVEIYTNDEKERIMQIYDIIFDSNLIFYPDKEFDKEPDSIASDERVQLLKELISIKTNALGRENKVFEEKGKEILWRRKEEIGNTEIGQLGFRTRTYHALEKSNITTVGKLLEKSEKDLIDIRDLGRKSIIEIQQKMLPLREELAEIEELIFPKLEESEQESDCTTSLRTVLEKRKKEIENTEIEQLGFGNRTFNALRRANIANVGKLLRKSEKDLIGISGLGIKSITEIQQKILPLRKELTEIENKLLGRNISSELEEREQDETQDIDTELEKLKATRDTLEQKLAGLKLKVAESEKLLESYNTLLERQGLDQKEDIEARGE